MKVKARWRHQRRYSWWVGKTAKLGMGSTVRFCIDFFIELIVYRFDPYSRPVPGVQVWLAISLIPRSCVHPHSSPGNLDLWTPSQVSCFSLLTGMSEPKTPSCFHFHGRRHLEFLRFHGRWIDSVWKSRSYAVALKENPFNVYIFWQLNSYRIQLYLWNFLNSQYRR